MERSTLRPFLLKRRSALAELSSAERESMLRSTCTVNASGDVLAGIGWQPSCTGDVKLLLTCFIHLHTTAADSSV